MQGRALALTILLAGCAGPIETRIDSSGANVAQPAHIALDPEVAGPTAAAQSLVAKALNGKGYRTAEKADYSVQVSVSDRPADLSLTAGKEVLAATPKRKLCAAREYRLGVTMTRIADAMVIYRSSASEYHCKLTLQQVLPYLVDAAVKDLGAPRGSYFVKRPRRSPPLTIPATSE